MVRALLVASALCVPASQLVVAGSSSAPLARELARVMADHKMDAIAALDPANPGRFVAALFLPGQLLVVSAQYPAGAVLAEHLARKAYREVYGALNDATVRDTKFFVQDIGADGLDSTGESIDVTYENAVEQTIFDGHPERHKISKKAYDEKCHQADDRYSGVFEAAPR